jgi:hypothetical protein
MHKQDKSTLFPQNKGKIRTPKFLPTRKGNNGNGGNKNNKIRSNKSDQLEDSVRRFEIEFDKFLKGSLNNYGFLIRPLIENGLHPEHGKLQKSFISFGYGKNMHQNIYNLVKSIYAETGVNLGYKIKKRLKGFFDDVF